jgi:hypothetical protein
LEDSQVEDMWRGPRMLRLNTHGGEARCAARARCLVGGLTGGALRSRVQCACMP